MRILRLAMGAAVALTWTVAISAAHAGDGRKALEILPSDTAGVFVINVDRFESSPHYADAMKFFRSQGGVGSNVDALKEAGALDLDKDIDTVIIGIPSKSDGDAGVMVLEGRFDAAKLGRAALSGEAPFTEKSHRGIAYWARDGSAFAVVGKRFVATKSNQRLEAVIDAFKKKTRSAARSKALKTLLKHVDATKDMWIVADSAMLKSAIPIDVEGITGNADLAVGLKVTVDMIMSSKKKADDLKAQLDMGMKSVASQPIVGPLLSNVSVTQSDTEVVVNGSFDDAQLAIIGGLMSKMGGGAF